MQEETMAMSDDEISDEVIMVDPSQSSSGVPQRLQKRDQNVIDNQLKAVGLYEEGLSAEQKEELLAVIAASEETAQQEESMRSRAREWQQKVFPSEMDTQTSSASTTCQSLLQPAYVNVVSESEVQNSLQMLNIEGPAEPSGSAEVFQSPEKISAKKSPEISQEFHGCISSENINAVQRAQKQQQQQQQIPRRGRPRRLRANCEVNDGRAIHGSLVFQSPEDEGELINIDEADFRRQKKDLEKCISEWQPCNSPEPPPVSFKRIAGKDDAGPYKCATEQCGQPIRNTVNKFHAAVSQLQRTSPFFLQWGCPITVGRAYATRSARARGPDSENSDGVYNFHFPNISDQSSTFNASRNSSYLRLREFDKKCELEKKCQMGLNVDSTGTVRTRTMNPVVNPIAPGSLNVINSKSSKVSACGTALKTEALSEDVCAKQNESMDAKNSMQSCFSNLTKSESVQLCKVSPSGNCSASSETKTLLCNQRKSLSETDVSTTTNGPIRNSFDETNSEEVIENCGSPLIVVDDDPFEEQENVTCTSEKGTCRKRMSAKVTVPSPSKRLKGSNNNNNDA